MYRTTVQSTGGKVELIPNPFVCSSDRNFLSLPPHRYRLLVRKNIAVFLGNGESKPSTSKLPEIGLPMALAKFDLPKSTYYRLFRTE
jgi:hypothetical protein